MTAQTSILGPDWIAVDWGTSSLRVWAIAADGSILARRSAQDGMGSLARDSYEDALLRLVGEFLPHGSGAPIPVVICGMAGAKTGWAEAGYRQAPCTPLARDGMIRVETRDKRLDVRILSGISQMSPADVMRGEETQLAGLTSRIGAETAVACLPGTHSKWVRLGKGRIASFKTFMTGELFAVMAEHSILRLSADTRDEDRDAFRSAVRDIQDRPLDLTAALFSIRASSLIEGLGAAAARSRLSGLLIGAELAATKDLWRVNPVHLVGSDRLADAYASAIEALGGTCFREHSEEITLAGLAVARKLIGEAVS
ncbi:2-dehydro-3-deoxygalactonokinase [Oricola sp.]|uniref:2-dehydro-3-deoxygalactonokinase n=1 Tax=Oricola sp. TaxID=1979950 RepID=UPI0025FC70C6|nr:2-dehydro-3-deoxygalactonokinase [Oricola sp.]MCI5078360.1 2-dehydro-3-deoxygalactonokinase [Oricola sp.]